MKKYLVLIAGAAIAYNLVGAAASSLTVTQSTIPAQGADATSTSVGSCTSEVTIQYAYLDNSDTPANTNLGDGNAMYVAAIIVAAAAGNTCTSDDLAALYAAGDGVNPPPAYTFDEANPAYTSGVIGSYNTDVVAEDGAWIFEFTTPPLISSFDPGFITVTLWREPATFPPSS